MAACLLQTTIVMPSGSVQGMPVLLLQLPTSEYGALRR